MKLYFSKKFEREYWLSLVLVSLLLTLTACSNATPTLIPVAAEPTLSPIQPAATKTVTTTQPPTMVGPSLTPAITPTAVGTPICQSSDLTIKPSWNIEEEHQDRQFPYLVGQIAFTNNTNHPCNLSQFSDGQLLDSHGQAVGIGDNTFRAYFVPNPTTLTQLTAGQTLRLLIRLQNKCDISIGSGQANFSLQLEIGSETALNIPGININGYAISETGRFGCYVLGMQVGPFENTLGVAFTATASSKEATAIAYSATDSARWSATETAAPPTPTPTVLPTAVPGAKPCRVQDLQVKELEVSSPTALRLTEWYLINTSSVVCNLKGYPTVQEVDPAGRPITEFTVRKINDFYVNGPADETKTPLVSVPPNHAAQIMDGIQRCDEGYDQTAPLRTLQIVLPDDTTPIKLDTLNRCPSHNEVALTNFQYAPGNWEKYLQEFEVTPNF